MNLFKKSETASTVSSNKKCYYCKEEILADAKVCKHCGKKQPTQITKKGVLIVGLIVLFIVTLGSIGSSTDLTQSTQTTQNSVSDRKFSSMAFAESIIKDTLKSPSTAEFTNVQAYELSNLKDVWAVNGYVDSQNSYGAMLRSTWEVQLDYRDGKGGTVKSILFDGKKIQ